MAERRPATMLADDLRRITAPNPGPMTASGTQSYLLGLREVAVIDPGPESADHLAAMLAALPEGGRVSHILVTHAHRDHCGGARALAAATGARLYAFGSAAEGRRSRGAGAALPEGVGGGEGVDADFAPDLRLGHGEELRTEEWALTALHTPGHMANHLCFAAPAHGAIFTGDTVMGWSTTLISPPDGSLQDFMASLDLLIARPEALYLPGHGEPVIDGPGHARVQRAHREARSAEILGVLGQGSATLADITAQVYADIPKSRHGAASRNVLAHLLALAEAGRIRLPEGAILRGRFALS